MLFNFTNLPYWILLVAGTLLFLLVIGTGGGEDDVELDSDVDADLDMDLDAEANLSAVESEFDAELDGEGEFSLGAMLGWLGIGKAPLLLLLAIDLSTWGLVGWMLNVLAGGLLGSIPTGAVGGLVLGGSFGIALATGSALSHPIGKIFAAFGEDASDDRLVGCVGRVSSARLPSVRSQQIGQIDVLDRARNLVTISACLPDWAAVPAQRGDEVLVIERLARGYLVIVKVGEDYETWLNAQQNSGAP